MKNNEPEKRLTHTRNARTKFGESVSVNINKATNQTVYVAIIDHKNNLAEIYDWKHRSVYAERNTMKFALCPDALDQYKRKTTDGNDQEVILKNKFNTLGKRNLEEDVVIVKLNELDSYLQKLIDQKN